MDGLIVRKCKRCGYTVDERTVVCAKCRCTAFWEFTPKKETQGTPFGKKTLQNSLEQRNRINVRNLIRVLENAIDSENILRESLYACKTFIESQKEES